MVSSASINTEASASELQEKIKALKEQRLVNIVKNRKVQNKLKESLNSIESDVISTLGPGISDDVLIKILVKDHNDDNSNKY
jgi:CII-binding regulator of phage lambda lysogenization HflD